MDTGSLAHQDPRAGPDTAAQVLDAARRLGAVHHCWAQPDQGHWLVGVGHAAEECTAPAHGLSTTLHRLMMDGSSWLGGMAFANRASGGWWTSFGVSRWVRPLVTVQARRGWVVSAVPHGARVPARQPRQAVLAAHGNRTQWCSLVEHALRALHSGQIQKVVTARRIDVQLAQPVVVADVLAHLARQHPSTHIFAHTAADGTTWLGATPETLLDATRCAVHVDALAGSMPPGIAFGPKEHLEHALVVEDVCARLQPFCATVDAPNAPVRRCLANIHHLHTPVHGVLNPGACAADVAVALAPTSAVGGLPRPEALAFLDAHEGLERGWYAGTVGMAGQGHLQLGVGLRAALVRGNRAQLYVGAGLVRGSRPESEWEETERKAEVMLKALAGGPL